MTLVPTEGDASARRSWRGRLRLRPMVVVVAIGGALAMVMAPLSGAGAAYPGVGAHDWLTSPQDAAAVAEPAACRQRKRTYRYRVLIEGSLDYTVTFKPGADGRGRSGSWGFNQDYTASDQDAKVRVDRMLGNCAGALGLAYLPPPGGSDPWDQGAANFNFRYHSTVKPVYPQGDPQRDDPTPPPCTYSTGDLLFTQVRGAPLLASWGRGLRFGFSSMLDPQMALDLVKSIADKQAGSCDAYHSSFSPGSVHLKSAVVKGIEFGAPAGAGEATALATIVRRNSSRLRFPVNRLAVGKNFELNSGSQHETAKVGSSETDKSTWQTNVHFTRLRK